VESSLWDAIEKVERRHWWFRGRRELVATVLRGRLATGTRVLDVGCGTGFVLERLAQHFDAWGLEPEETVRARALPEIRPRILSGSTDDLTAVDKNSFDAVTLLDVLEHIKDDEAALRNVLTVLRPGGFVLVTVPAFPSLWSSHDELNQHRRRYSKTAFRTLLDRAGLEPSIVSYVNARLFPLALVHRALARVVGGSASGPELAVPPNRLNELFARVFAGEARSVGRGYPFGLSLLGLAKVPA
jgi:SAM-dependent methyltransferase